jgi:hypothetical protein
MAVAKYNWEALKADYLSSHDPTLKAFCKRKGLPDPSKNSFIAKMVSGWAGEKEDVKKRALELFVEQAAEELLLDTKSVRLDHARLAAEVIKKAMEYLRSEMAEIKSVEQARKLLETGVKIQQDALGLKDNVGKDQKLTQINIMTSRFGIEDADEAELLSIIGAVRARRERVVDIGESSQGTAGQEIGETTPELSRVG